mgnify:CR=1 FL=1
MNGDSAHAPISDCGEIEHSFQMYSVSEAGGRIAEEDGRRDEADRWFDQAADVWTQAVRLNPGGYLDIENWLKSTGRSNVDVYF